MDHKERMELQRQAQDKLSEASRLVREAGKLAKKGQFVLSFSDGGTFIPKRYKDPELYRDEALEELKTEGWMYYDGSQRVTRQWDSLSDDEKERAIDDRIESIIDNLDVPWEYRDYDDGEGHDGWWTPSTC